MQPAQLLLVDPPGQLDPVQPVGCAGSAPSAGAAGPHRRSSRAAAPPGRGWPGPRAAPPARPAAACGSPAASRRRRAPDAGYPPRRARSTGRHHAASTPLGTTSTTAPRAAADTRAAAILDTAFSATPRPAQRERWPSARNTPVERAMTQWKVAVTGSPASRATGTRSVANGLTTPEVRVGDVEAPGVEPATHLTRCERVHRDAARQRDREPVHRDAVVAGGGVAAALAVRAGGRGEHLDLVAGEHQLAGEVAHLALDATQPRRVAVGEHGDLHEAPACHARGWATMSPTIVAFHAHPDDEALLTAGTMARAAAAGPPRGPGARDRRRGRAGGRRAARRRRPRRAAAGGGPAVVRGARGGPGRVARLRRQRQRGRARAGRPRGHPVLPGPGRGGGRAARRRAAHRAGRPAAVVRRQRRLRPPRPRAGAPGGRARRRDRRHPPGAGGHRAPRHDRAGGAGHRPRLPLPRRSSTRPRSSGPSPPAPTSPTG